MAAMDTDTKTAGPPVRFDTKIAVVLRDDLEVWQRLNVDLFTTGNDRDNRAAVRAVRRTDLDLAGLAVYGPRNAVDKIVKGAHLHP
jgi:hypothetical protein